MPVSFLVFNISPPHISPKMLVFGCGYAALWDFLSWQAIRLSGSEGLAARASRKLRNDELLVTNLGGTRLRMEIDRVPLWRLPAATPGAAAQAGGDHVAIRQIIEDFARYAYLPRVMDPGVVVRAAVDGVALLTWDPDTFAYAESYDEDAGRYRGLRSGANVTISESDTSVLLVKPDVALKIMEAEQPTPPPGPGPEPTPPPGPRSLDIRLDSGCIFRPWIPTVMTWWRRGWSGHEFDHSGAARIGSPHGGKAFAQRVHGARTMRRGLGLQFHQ